MKIVEGVYLHLIKTDKFKTNHLTFRFSADVTKVNKARRALVAQMLATSNADYPSSRLFRQKLAELYGANLSTTVSMRGLAHLIDIDLSFIAPHLLPKEASGSSPQYLTEIFAFLKGVIQHPLKSVEQFQTTSFDTEKHNLMSYLESDKEDSFYASDLSLKKLYFQNEHLRDSSYSSSEQVASENSYTAFQEWRRLLENDRIDIFFVGDITEEDLLAFAHSFNFSSRRPRLRYSYQQPFTNVINQVVERRDTHQSVFNLAYHVPIVYGDFNYPALLVFNGLLGLFPHSLLFTNIREKEGLTYSISSHLSPFQGLLTIQAGISRMERQRTMQLINRQFELLRLGRFSSELLRQTKKMLAHAAALSTDSPKSLIETSYNRTVAPSPEDADQLLLSVTKRQVIEVANQIRLQSFYFLEGDE